MSVSDSYLFNRTYDTKKFYPLTMLSLNDIFKESMRKVQSEFGQANVIVRCDSLPQIRGNQQDISEVFKELMRMIIATPASDERLFLHLDCAETKGVQVLDEEFRSYTIKFRTNTLQGENWEASHRETLERCKRILSMHQADFLVNSNNTHGCLFSISLPGKI